MFAFFFSKIVYETVFHAQMLRQHPAISPGSCYVAISTSFDETFKLLKLVLGLSVSVTCLLYSCKMFVRSLQLLLFLISKVTLEERILSNRKYHYKTITCVTNDADLTDSSNIDFATECINKCKFSSDVSIVTIIEEAARVKRYLFSMR